MIEYGGKVEKMPETNVMYTNKGFQMVGNGLRIDLDSYKDLINWINNFDSPLRNFIRIFNSI